MNNFGEFDDYSSSFPVPDYGDSSQQQVEIVTSTIDIPLFLVG